MNSAVKAACAEALGGVLKEAGVKESGVIAALLPALSGAFFAALRMFDPPSVIMSGQYTKNVSDALPYLNTRSELDIWSNYLA